MLRAGARGDQEFPEQTVKIVWKRVSLNFCGVNCFLFQVLFSDSLGSHSDPLGSHSDILGSNPDILGSNFNRLGIYFDILGSDFNRLGKFSVLW